MFCGSKLDTHSLGNHTSDTTDTLCCTCSPQYLPAHAYANNFRDFGCSHNPDMHTPAPIMPQQQNTKPSRNCVRTCVLDLRFVVRLLGCAAERLTWHFGLFEIQSQPLEQPPLPRFWLRRLFRVKWRSQCLKATASLRHLARLLQTPLYGYVRETSRSRWGRWSQRAASSVNVCLHGPSQVDSPPNTRLSSSETKWKKRCRLQGPTKDEGFHTEHKDEATEYWEGAGRELHCALLARRAWSVHTRCTHIKKSMSPL